jgi:hypothetical protein
MEAARLWGYQSESNALQQSERVRRLMRPLYAWCGVSVITLRLRNAFPALVLIWVNASSPQRQLALDEAR